MKTLLSLGHGFSGQATEAALGPGWRVLGTSRKPGQAVLWPDQAAEALARATHLICWVPPEATPEATGDPMVPWLQDLPAPNLRWIGYASATSLYGDHGGAWIDESAPDAPATGRGYARAKAEHDWQAFAEARRLPLALFRIAGIYGPGRSALDALRQGRAHRVWKEGQVFNRIHVADLGRIAAAAAEAELAGPLICADDEPAPMADVTLFAARLLGMEPPPLIPFEKAELSPMARSFYEDSKRLRSRRLGPELGFTPLYPSYREGLSAIHDAGA